VKRRAGLGLIPHDDGDAQKKNIPYFERYMADLEDRLAMTRLRRFISLPKSPVNA